MKLNLFRIVFIVSLLIVLFSLNVTFARNEDPFPAHIYKTAWETIYNKFYFKPSVDLLKWQNKFANKIQSVDDAHKCINKLIKNLNDPYTRFLTQEEFETEQKIINSRFTGIGIKLSIQKPVILDIISNSPAQKADIKPGDLIISVNDKKTRRLTANQVAALIHSDIQSSIKIKLKRKEQIIEKSVVPEELNFNAISSKLLPNNVLLVKIDSFIPENTSRLFENEITKYTDLTGLILDLRNNSGGLLKNAIKIADLFLTSGKIVSTVNKISISNDFANSNQLYANNIVILVNENTASASEILTAALKENERAYVIGKKTFGKGLVQEIVQLPDGSALHVTSAVYLTPQGHYLNQKGIIPDEIIIDSEKQLQRAIEIVLAQKDLSKRLKIASRQ